MPGLNDLKKVKKIKNRFQGIDLSEPSSNLEAPEVAPLPIENKKKSRKKTGRTKQFATRVSESWDEDFRTIAFTQKLKNAELLEDMLQAYKEKKGLKPEDYRKR